MEIINTYPAYTIYKNDGVAFEDGDEFAIGFDSKSHGRLYNFYRLGSVEGCARKYNEDPVEAVERATANKHKLFWANPQATVIHNGPKSHRYVVGINKGDTIVFKGRAFRVEAVPYDRVNIQLVEISDPDLDKPVEQWAAEVEADMVKSTQGFHTNF